MRSAPFRPRRFHIGTLALFNGAVSLLLISGPTTAEQAAAATAAATPAAGGKTYVVRSIRDGGDAAPGNGRCANGGWRCTLRAAIIEANAHLGRDRIVFRIGEGGRRVIAPRSELPAITEPVVLDATTQPGFQGRPLIVLSGKRAGGADGLVVSLSHRGQTVIRGLAVVRFEDGIELLGEIGGTRLAGNYIGTKGARAFGNRCTGVLVLSRRNEIGGTVPRDRNVISGNGCAGVLVYGPGATDNVIHGNFIGVAADGRTPLGNLREGVAIYRARRTLVGGPAAAARNVISGNGWSETLAGVGIYQPTATRNVVRGNFIGTDVTGTTKIPNASLGIGVTTGAHGNLIGGYSPGSRNLISGNARGGIGIKQPGTSRNLVVGNYIGTDVTGRRALGNGVIGIVIEYGATANRVGGVRAGSANVISGNRGRGVAIYHPDTARNSVVGNLIGTGAGGRGPIPNQGGGVIVQSSGNTIGGTFREAGNLIAYNVPGNGNGAGVTVSSGTSNVVRSNSIHHNSSIGIDLGNNGPSRNDRGDADAGANRMQNAPVLVSASPQRVGGRLRSAPDVRFVIDVYVSASCTGTRLAEGRRLLGRVRVETNGSGVARFGAAFPRALATGKALTATATDRRGNTSEFSRCISVTA